MTGFHHPCSSSEPPLPDDLAGKSPAAIAVALATRQLIGELTGDMGMAMGLPEGDPSETSGREQDDR
jgi:hypothetical protein